MTSQPVELENWEQEAIQALTAQMQDPQQALEDAEIETAAGGNVGAGVVDRELGKFLSDPTAFCQHQRLKALVARGLHQLLEECDLGAGLSAAQSTGKALLEQRLQQPADEIQQQLRAVLAEDLSSHRDRPLPETAQASLRQVIRIVLLADDWEAISLAAAQSLEQRIKAVVMLPQSA